MLKLLKVLLILIIFTSCNSTKEIQKTVNENSNHDLVIAFGSCNKQFLENKLWDDILTNKPVVWIWGGDNIYSDTSDMIKMKKDYEQQFQQKGYTDVVNSTKILGIWDDHDYGLNDGGEEFEMRNESQQLFLDFLNVPEKDARRDRLGTYHSEVVKTKNGSVKLILLDTRFFRTALTKSNIKGRRYDPNIYGDGTILGKEQWKWLKSELNNSDADFNIIMSSIQVIAEDHGFERWATMPHQRDNLFRMISSSSAKNIILLSGDRHISEFSKINLKSLDYPLIDFTSSGLTHSYSNFTEELNKHRQGEVVSDISFGVLRFNFDEKIVTMQMRGENDVLQQELIQRY